MESGLGAVQSNGKGLPLEVSGKSGLVLQEVLQWPKEIAQWDMFQKQQKLAETHLTHGVSVSYQS